MMMPTAATEQRVSSVVTTATWTADRTALLELLRQSHPELGELYYLWGSKTGHRLLT